MPETFASPLIKFQLTGSQSIESRLQALEQWMQRSQSGNTNFSSLDMVGNDLGNFQAGEITVGDGTVENGDLTGVAILYPPVTISGSDWNFVGMNAGVLEVGISATDGKLYAGGGSIVIDSTAITLTADVYPSSAFIQWMTSEVTPVKIGDMVATYAGALTNSGMLVNGYAHDAGVYGLVELAAYDFNPANFAGLIINSQGQLNIDLRSGTNVTAGTQAVDVATKISSSVVTNTVLYLDSSTTGNSGHGQTGFGTGLSLRASNGAGTMVTIGSLFANYSTATAGAETTSLFFQSYTGGVSASGQIWPSPSFPGTLTVGGGDAVDLIASATFTPAIAGTSTAGAGTYSVQTGIYYVIGHIVFVEMIMTWSAHTGTGNMIITGLPFTSANATYSNGSAFTVNWNNITLLAVGNKILARNAANTSTIILEEIGSAASSALPLDTAATIRVSGFFFK